MSLLSPALEAFMAVVKHQTVHAAAEHLHLTQTAVTQRIKALEERLKTTLFVRSRRGMTLTTEGEALLHYCQAAQNLAGQTLAKIHGAGEISTVSLRLSGPSSMMRSRVIPQCVPVMQQFPNLLLHFDINDIETRHVSLHKGDCDLALLQKEHLLPEMKCKLLAPEEYVLVACPAWAKRPLAEVIRSERIIDFDLTDQLTFAYLKHFRLFNHARLERHYANRTEDLALLVAAGLGYGLLTKEFSKPYVERGELCILNDGKAYLNQMALAWFDRPQAPGYFRALVGSIT